MSTLRVSNIEAKADVSSPTVDEKLKITNSSGDALFHLDGKTTGITTVGVNTTGNTFTVDSNNNVTFSGISTFSSGLNVTGGSVGIGTDNPSANLDVRGTADAPTLTWNGSGQTIIGDTTNQLSVGRLNSSPFALYLQGRASNDAARDILLNPVGGDVGIGTATPGARLEVSSGTSSQVIIKTPGANNTARATRLSFAFDDGEGAAIQSTRITGGSTLNCNLSFRTGGVTNSEERLGIGTDGNVSINNGNLVFSTSGTGIDFSATDDSSGTMTSELLDDYEEGTWTPTIDLSVSSPTYSKQEGNYTKIGNVVTVSCTLAISNGTTDGSTFRVGGFPFTTITLTDRAFTNIVKANSVSSNGEKLLIYMNSNATTAFLNVQSSTSTGGFTGNQFGSTGSISFSITYMAA